MEILKYTDEADRCYGATGMAIALLVFDGDDMLSSIDIDGDPNEMVAMSPDFYFAGNPGVSAKTAWNRMLKNYNIGIGMLAANLLCRHIVHQQHALPSELHDFLHDFAMEEGRESCSLEKDEIEQLFDKNLSYLNRVFAHRGVQAVAHDFASTLMTRRSLSRIDALELLSSLRML